MIDPTVTHAATYLESPPERPLPELAARSAAYLVVALDEQTHAAAALHARRMSGDAPLSGQRDRVRAVRVGPQGARGLSPAPDNLLQAGLDAWSGLRALAPGRLYVLVMRTVADEPDLTDLLEAVERVAGNFRDGRVPMRCLACAVLLRPAYLLDLGALRDLRGRALTILVDFFPPSGPIPQVLVPGALAEFLEVLCETGPDALFGPIHEVPAEHAIAVVLDGIEAPSTLERAYATLHLARIWLEGIRPQEPCARTGRDDPTDAVRRAAATMRRHLTADRACMSKAALRHTRALQRDVDAHLHPQAFAPLPPSEQAAFLAVTNARVVAPDGLRDRLLQDLAAVYARRVATPSAARAEAHWLVGHFDGGIALAQELVLQLIDQIEDLHRRQDAQFRDHPGPCAEPDLIVDPALLREAPASPRGAPWRTLLAWTALVAGGLACIAASLPPLRNASAPLRTLFGADAGVAARALLLATPAVFLALCWQLMVWLRARRHRRVLARLPRSRARRLLRRWVDWFTWHEIPRRLEYDLQGLLDDLQTIDRRLDDLVRHLLTEEQAMRDALVQPSFPRRIAGHDADLDALVAVMERRYSLAWCLDRLRERWGVAMDSAAFGACLCSMLESMVLAHGPALASGHRHRSMKGTPTEESLSDVAAQAVADELAQHKSERLDERLRSASGTIEAMLAACLSEGAYLVGAGRLLAGDPHSALAAAARAGGCTVLDRADHARATLMIITALQL